MQQRYYRRLGWRLSVLVSVAVFGALNSLSPVASSVAGGSSSKEERDLPPSLAFYSKAARDNYEAQFGITFRRPARSEVGTVGIQSDYDDLPIIREYLNPIEQQLYLAHPVDGTRAILAAKDATNLTQSSYENACLHNGNGDAFRHATWNALMVLRIGATRAKEWGDAHEDGAAGNPALEKQMDLFNNAVGRTIRFLQATMMQPSCPRSERRFALENCVEYRPAASLPRTARVNDRKVRSHRIAGKVDSSELRHYTSVCACACAPAT